jgi:hypothetical protein
MTPLFIELCAGTAALSLRLHHPRARPPVSRMGAKTGYADVILRVLGLRPGGQAAHYLWAEPDAGVRLLLEAYRSRELATAAADIIRGWKDEDPRALWERLRAEGPARCPPVDPAEVARWLWIAQRAYRQGEPQSGGPVKIGDGGRWAQPLEDSLPGAPTLPATITDDARKVDPREVARWVLGGVWSYRQGEVASGFIGPGQRRQDTTATATALSSVPTLPATITDDARKMDPPQLPAGTVAYMDPPYLNTTGYAHDLGRPEVIRLAERWQAAGAQVCISEAEPIPELLAQGWHAVEITGERVGQKRTFSKQQREWLTLSHAPSWKPSVQIGLFGGAA